MKRTSAPSRASRALALAAAATALFGCGSLAAMAGSCPPDKVLKEPRKIEDMKDVGISRQTLAVINVTGWRNVGNLRLRTRRLTIPVGGVIPTHEHDDRPSIVYVVQGEVIEHSSFCSVPIVHKQNEWTPEFGKGHAHWWENKGNEPVVVTSSDIVPPDMLDDPEM